VHEINHHYSYLERTHLLYGKHQTDEAGVKVNSD